MKIVFAGTPEFAAQAMRAIDRAGHEIVLVLTQPDRRAGRGMHIQVSPVKAFAQEKNIPILQPETLKQTHADLQKRSAAQEAYRSLSSIDFEDEFRFLLLLTLSCHRRGYEKVDHVYLIMSYSVIIKERLNS